MENFNFNLNSSSFFFSLHGKTFIAAHKICRIRRIKGHTHTHTKKRFARHWHTVATVQKHTVANVFRAHTKTKNVEEDGRRGSNEQRASDIKVTFVHLLYFSHSNELNLVECKKFLRNCWEVWRHLGPDYYRMHLKYMMQWEQIRASQPLSNCVWKEWIEESHMRTYVLVIWCFSSLSVWIISSGKSGSVWASAKSHVSGEPCTGIPENNNITCMYVKCVLFSLWSISILFSTYLECNTCIEC